MSSLAKTLQIMAVVISGAACFAWAGEKAATKAKIRDEVEKKGRRKLTFVYVHGFGEGGKKEIPFVRAMKKTIADLGLNAEVKAYIHNTERLDFLNIIAQWRRHRDQADQAGAGLYRDVITKLEQQQQPYYIIAYSMGTRVTADCLEQSDQKLKYLKGIYFIGSALPHDAEVSNKMLPEGMKIINYYSKGMDVVLKVSYKTAENTDAAGEVGFDDTELFTNYRTVCTHVPKGGPLARDYSDMTEALCFLTCYKEGIHIDGDEPNYNIKSRVFSGKLTWNDLIELDSKEHGKILLQYNVTTNHYRAVQIKENGNRYRLAWGINLHTILTELGLFPEMTSGVAGK